MFYHYMYFIAMFYIFRTNDLYLLFFHNKLTFYLTSLFKQKKFGGIL
jgi:hypothetical protein